MSLMLECDYYCMNSYMKFDVKNFLESDNYLSLFEFSLSLVSSDFPLIIEIIAVAIEPLAFLIVGALALRARNFRLNPNGSLKIYSVDPAL